ncbi:MAG: glycosyltransferase family 4 protein [Lachnospiraceae bacterium]|nr:glycosyltransferase family 4 protein [Lachnospiraceae bacterium]
MNKKIYVNGIGLTDKEIFGVQRYTFEILKELDKMVEYGSIVVLVPQKSERKLQFNNIIVEEIDSSFYNPKKIRFWKSLRFRSYVKKRNGLILDLSLNLPFMGADIVAIHDCITEKVKQNCDTVRRKVGRYLYMLRAFMNLKRSKIVITVSEHAKKDISKYYNIAQNKIKVVYPSWQHFNRIKEDESIIEELGIEKKKFCFSLGSRYYHKNFKWVLEAARQNSSYKFVVTGSESLGSGEEDFERNKPENLIFTGYLSDERVKALMSHCMAFIQPSFYEGFGLPPLEAMSTGAKCIVSNATSLPEIYGDSVWYIDPYDYENINIDEIMRAPIEDNSKVLKKYSWKKSAKKIKKIIDYVQIKS